MALRVPLYDDPQVNPAALPGVRVSTNAPIEAFGGGAAGGEGVNRQVRQVAGQLQEGAEQDYQRANRVRMYEDNRAFDDWEAVNLYDLKTGALSQMGKNAFEARVSVDKSFEQFVQEREKGLQNDDQRLAFQGMVEERRGHYGRRVRDHVIEQGRVVERAELDASLESSKERAARDASTVPMELAYVRKLAQERAQSHGLGPAAAAQYVQEQETDLHGRVINSKLAAGQDLDASAYFASVKDRLDPDVATKIQGHLKDGSRAGEARRISDEILSGSATQEEALSKLQKKNVQDTKIYDEARRRIRDEFTLRKKAKAERQEQYFNDAWKWVERHPNDLNMYIARREDMAPGDWEKLEHQASNILLGKKPVTNRNTYEELMLMSSLEPEKFKTYNLQRRSEELSDTDYKKFVDIRAEITGKGRSQEADGYLEKKQIVDGFIVGLGLDSSPPQKDGEYMWETVSGLRTIIDRAYASELTRAQEKTPSKKSLSNEETRKLVKDTIETVRGAKESTGVFGWGAGRFTLKPGAVDQIPMSRADRAEIVAELKKLNGGVEPTPEQITDTYNAWARKNAGK